MMVDKINEGLPQGKQLSIFWWGSELRKKFRQRYPLSMLVLIRDLCVGLMVLCFAFVVIWDFR